MSSIASSHDDDAQLAFPRTTRRRTLSFKTRSSQSTPPGSPPLAGKKDPKPHTPKRERVRSFLRRVSSTKIIKRDSSRDRSEKAESVPAVPEVRSFEVVGVFHTNQQAEREHPSPALSGHSSSYSDSPPPLSLSPPSIHSRASSNTMASVHQGVLGGHKRTGSSASTGRTSDRASVASTAYSAGAAQDARHDKGDAPDVIIEAPGEDIVAPEAPVELDPSRLVGTPPAPEDDETPDPFVVDDAEHGGSSEGAASPPPAPPALPALEPAALMPPVLEVPEPVSPAAEVSTPSTDVALTPTAASPAPVPEALPVPTPVPVLAPAALAVPVAPAAPSTPASPARASAPASPLDVHKPVPPPPPAVESDSSEDEFDPELFVPALVLPTLFLPIPNVRRLIRSSLSSYRTWWSRRTMDGPYALLLPASLYAVGLLAYRARR